MLIQIDTAVLNKIPRGRILRAEETRDMDGKLRDAIVVGWWDGHDPQIRKSFFDIKTAEYLGETF